MRVRFPQALQKFLHGESVSVQFIEEFHDWSRKADLWSTHSMDPSTVTQSPFAALTFVAAPALLTNASSVLAMSTINRMLRARERMQQLLDQSEQPAANTEEEMLLARRADRVERQGMLLLRALHFIYVALAAFASATLVTLLGTGLAPFVGDWWPRIFAAVGVVLGLVGVSGLVLGCGNLFRSTQLSLLNISEEAALIRKRQAARLAVQKQKEVKG